MFAWEAQAGVDLPMHWIESFIRGLLSRNSIASPQRHGNLAKVQSHELFLFIVQELSCQQDVLWWKNQTASATIFLEDLLFRRVL
ncbi:unnamed protein product [Cyprideis torosa]|uniref:Uncharacterized protein n=1 Tax=Cyprideis torosa TaxID=163714 RepID=A0A7R8WKF0_9CRUS|nr:unnamed protein product [Cyprideis torosa]CAG0900391.1 unnamed protein product [Cyprideis torosa]